MSYFVDQILNATTHIDRCISRIQNDPDGRLEQATNISNSIRQLAEHCICLVYERDSKIPFDYASGSSAYVYFHERAKQHACSHYPFLFHIHERFQGFCSHNSNFDDENLRTLIGEFENLVQIKVFLKSDFQLDVLQELYQFPLDMDQTFASYYRTIFKAIDTAPFDAPADKDYYYVQSQRLIYLDGRKLFEITVYPVMSQRSPTNRIIVFSETEILTFYAVQLELVQTQIALFDSTVAIHFLKKWSVSIRPCELNDFDELMGIPSNHNRSHAGYAELMGFITASFWTIPDIVRLSDDEFYKLTDNIFKQNHKKTACRTLERLHKIVQSRQRGSNVLLYLSSSMNDELISSQHPRNPLWYPDDNVGGGLYLSCGTLTFDRRPFTGKLIDHRPPFSLLIRCFDPQKHQDELFARGLETYSNETGRIYLNCATGDLVECETHKTQYNRLVSSSMTENRIGSVGEYYFLRSNESSTHSILSIISEKAKIGDPNYAAKASKYLTVQNIEDEKKRLFISNAFSNSSIAFLCGRAGTGKSTAISYLCKMLGDESVLVLAQTKPALDRLKRVITGSNVVFSTIEKATLCKHDISLLVIDESSVVSNRDLNLVFQKNKFKKAVFAGDQYQLQSIEFGNWFVLGMKVFHAQTYELETEYRGGNYARLKKFWSAVRSGGQNIESALSELRASRPLDKDVFKRGSDDEIVLCLNYNGLYGINCINDYLQSANPNVPYKINHKTFKAGDPILFIDTARFGSVLYNNLKGKIKNITPTNGGLSFRLLVNLDLRHINHPYFVFHGYKDGVSEIEITVLSSAGSDDKAGRQNYIVPFQLAYAVSIHKAQGLEFDSVKIVIANDVEERITSNIFYTAITRSKKELTIYWTPESQRSILANLNRSSLDDDYKLYFQAHPFTTY